MKRSRALKGLTLAAATALVLSACGGDSGGDTDPTTSGGGGETSEEAGGNEGGDIDPTTADTVWKLAFNQTDAHPQYKAAVNLGAKLYEATEGRYGIEVFPNELLGTQADVVNNVSDGSVEMMWIGGPVMESFNEDFIVFNLPYMFASQEAQNAVFTDESVVGELFTSIEDSKRITVLGAGYAGSRNVYATSPVREPADLEGLKIRVQQSDSQVRMIELMGAVASPMGQGEVYTALQSGVLDGAENNPTVFNALKHDEVAKYYSFTEHLMIPDYLIINTDVLNGMDDADREAFKTLVAEAVQEANTGFFDFIDQSKENSLAAGAEFVEDVDVDAFRELVAPLVAESINNPVRQALYDAVQEANGN